MPPPVWRRVVSPVPEDERGEFLEWFKAKVRVLLRNGGLPLVTDYEHCIQQLDMGALELETLAEQRGPIYKAFEGWIGEFPWLAVLQRPSKGPLILRSSLSGSGDLSRRILNFRFRVWILCSTLASWRLKRTAISAYHQNSGEYFHVKSSDSFLQLQGASEHSSNRKRTHPGHLAASFRPVFHVDARFRAGTAQHGQSGGYTVNCGVLASRFGAGDLPKRPVSASGGQRPSR